MDELYPLFFGNLSDGIPSVRQGAAMSLGNVVKAYGMLHVCLLEWFSFECRKTKTKVITLANHIGHRQYIEPIKTRSNYMWLTQSAGKCMRAHHNWLWFYF